MQQEEDDFKAAIEASLASSEQESHLIRAGDDTQDAHGWETIPEDEAHADPEPDSDEMARIYHRQDDRWVEGGEPTSATAILQAIPGLRNRKGEHNCFLNVNVQAFSSLPALRDTFLHLPPQLKGEFHNVM